MLDVSRLEVLRHVEIHEDASCSSHSGRHFLQAKTLERADAPEFLEPFACGRFDQHPVFQFEGKILAAEEALYVVLTSAQVQYFFGCEVGQQFVDGVAVSLSGKELAGGDVEERYTDDMFVKMETSYPVVLFLGEGSVGIADARGDQFGHASFDQFLGQFGILQLVADSDTQSGTNEFGQIGIEGMEGKARHL